MNGPTEVWHFVRKQVDAGHQAYVVYPVIEENEETELKAALKMYNELSKKMFPDLQVGLLHGRMEAGLERAGHAAVSAGRDPDSGFDHGD